MRLRVDVRDFPHPSWGAFQRVKRDVSVDSIESVFRKHPAVLRVELSIPERRGRSTAGGCLGIMQDRIPGSLQNVSDNHTQKTHNNRDTDKA